jgi:hypothetical protein
MIKRNRYTEEYLKPKKFNCLIFISFDTPIHGGEKRCKWQCDCGKTPIIDLYSVVSGRTKSCGHVKKGLIKENNNNWKGIGDIYGDKWTRIEKSAHKRQLDFLITKDDAWNLFLKQERKCAITHLPIHFKTKYNACDGDASLDRIDSSKGYTADNIQWVHKDINTMKQSFSQAYFIKLCKDVAHANA